MLFPKTERSQRKQAQDFEKWLEKKSEAAFQEASSMEDTMLIPVVVHVIHNGEPYGMGGNLPDEQIFSQIRVINEDFSRRNPDTLQTPDAFRSVARGIPVRFVLAKQDPDGEPSNGIVRLDGGRAFWMQPELDLTMKGLSRWNPDRYLNIWVANIVSSSAEGKLLGYASFPVQSGLDDLSDDGQESEEQDGVVVHSEHFGSAEDENEAAGILFPSLAGSAGANRGRTLTHELGHFFGLYHTFNPEGLCRGPGDYCEDTPAQRNPNRQGCNHLRVSCESGAMQIQNYMDYSPDECMNLFTRDQTGRMKTVLQNSPRRWSLVNAIGAQDPSVSERVLDAGIVSVASPSVVHGSDTAVFVLNVENKGTLEVNSLVFELLRGQEVLHRQLLVNLRIPPNSVRAVSVGEVTGFGEGEHEIDVMVSSPNGEEDADLSDNRKAHRFKVAYRKGQLPFGERFDELLSDWTSFSSEKRISWERGEEDGEYFFELEHEESDAQEEVWLVSPIFDFSVLANGLLRFELRGRQQESLRMEIFVVSGFPEYYTGDIFDLAEVTADWNGHLLDLSEFANGEQRHVRLAFRLELPAYAGVVQLDNLNFYESYQRHTQRPDELVEAPLGQFAVFPNPSVQGVFNLNFNYEAEKSVKVEVLDLAGRLLLREEYGRVLNQTFRYELGEEMQSILIVRIITEDGVAVRQVMMR
ncbi:MAG: T9SS type A sorting domain-containing protein [Cytophagales bacterium]|nr:T9SS type A sorting domain-containing protein [Cytophagales bacterium]